MADIIGIDVSHHQGTINWDITKGMGVKYAFIKAGGDSTTGFYKDRMLIRNASECKRVEIPQSYYWYLYPHATGEAQANTYYSYVKDLPRHPKLGLMLDFEEDLWSAAQNTRLVVDFYNRMLYYGMPIEFLYTRAEFLHRESVLNPVWLKMKLFIARYIAAPKPWGNTYDYEWMTPPYYTNWFFWQYSANGNLQGKRYGAESYDIDLSIYNGTEEQWKAFLGETPIPVPPPTPPPTPPVFKKYVKVIREGGQIVRALNDRKMYIGLLPNTTKFIADGMYTDAGIAYFVSGKTMIPVDGCVLLTAGKGGQVKPTGGMAIYPKGKKTFYSGLAPYSLKLIYDGEFETFFTSGEVMFAKSGLQLE
jgi:GH25 family lysozyme M1 (1,4-beta-N-acetylmuramidase)